MINVFGKNENVSSLSYKPRLDGLRCLAIGSVMVYHYIYWLGGPFEAGYYGVNLFFVLSGFLITNILIKEGNESFKVRYVNFIGRRALRIFPVYYLTLFLLYLFNAPHIQERFIYLATYTYNFIVPEVDWYKDAFAHYWSLCVEEQFYLVFPFIAISLRNHLRALLIICAVVIVISYLQLYLDIFNIHQFVTNIDYFKSSSLLTHIAPLSLGAAGAIFFRKRKLPDLFHSREVEIIVIISIIAGCYFLHWTHLITFCSFLNLFLILKAYHAKFSVKSFDKIMVHPYVLYFGKISYGLYIYHQLISAYLDEFVVDPLWLRIPFEKFGFLSDLEYHPWFFKSFVYTFLTIIVASYSYFKFEVPILKLKDKLFGTRKSKPGKQLATPAKS